MVLVTRRCPVALLGGHYVFHLEEIDVVSVSSNHKIEKPAEEQRLMNIWKQVDLTKHFYFRCAHSYICLSQIVPTFQFSYTYDLTSTLQHNLTRPYARRMFNDRFAWNYHMMTKAFVQDVEFDKGDREKESLLKCQWLLPLVHGHVDQASQSSIFV